MWRVLILALLVCFTEARVQANENALQQEESAVALARSGNYAEALEKLAILANNGLNTALFDEIVVLGWAERHPEAIDLYEKHMGSAWPEYVQLSVAGSYYRLGNFKTAAGIYHEAAQNSPQAKRWEAESLMRSGDTAKAESLYAELLAANVQDIDTYISRGNLRLLAGDIAAGLDDLDIALAMAGDTKMQADLRAQLAVLSIRNEDFDRAINYLKPAVDKHYATMFMQADYILALWLNEDYTAAVREGAQLWPDYQRVPAYGLQALGDANLRSKQYCQAVKIYNSLLTRNPAEIRRQDVLGGLAYAAMNDGQVERSKEVYKTLLHEFPAYAATAVGDAEGLINSGAYWRGQELFNLIVSVFPDKPLYRQRFALAMARQGLHRTAAEEYQALGNLFNAQPQAGAGLTVNSLAAGDYQTARQGVAQLSSQPENKPVVASARKKFEERPLGEAQIYAVSQSDYKGNESKEISISGEQQISDRLSVSAAAGTKENADQETSITYKNRGAGLNYKDLWQTAELGGNFYTGDVSAEGFHAGYTSYFGDQNSLTFQFDRIPVDQANAVKNGILQTSQRLAYDKSLGRNDSYSLGFTRAAYSDGNAAFGYDGQWTHVYYDKNDIVYDWRVYFNRSSFRQQEVNGIATPYESPSLREVYGLAFHQRWNFPRSYWENTLSFAWNRDHPETFSFVPQDRLSYNYRPTPQELLSIAVQYGLRTSSTGGGLWFANRGYEVNYQISW